MTRVNDLVLKALLKHSKLFNFKQNFAHFIRHFVKLVKLRISSEVVNIVLLFVYFVQKESVLSLRIIDVIVM